MALTVKTKDWKAGRRWARRNAFATPGVTYTIVRDGTIDIDDNPSVIAQLSARRYTVQGDRRLKLESKDDFKKRSSTGGSPDDADALAMCWAAPGPGVGVW